jgi:hypothetical protein
MSFIAIGFPLALEKISAEALSKEQEARKRKPLREVFYTNHWGEQSL